MKSSTAIVLAAGRGRRFGAKISKALARIKSIPVIIYSLEVLSRCADIKEIIVAVNPSNRKEIQGLIKKYKIAKVSHIVSGGRRRQDSVLNGLSQVDQGSKLVLIHDGVRPFISREVVSLLIKEAAKSGAAILGVPVKVTIKEATTPPRHPASPAGGHITRRVVVKRTLDRKNLWEIQTPQVFRKGLLVKAYKKFGRIDATDDAMLVEKLAARVSIVMGSYDNIKITTPEDLAIAEAIIKSNTA